MSYISAFLDKDVINIVERKGGKRLLKKDSVEHIFYTLDEYGDYTTIFGDKCAKHTFQRRSELYQAKKKYDSETIYEDDVNPVFRYLSKNYDFNETAELNIAYYDIEVAFHPKTRYSNPDRADNEVISVAVYQGWTNTMFLLAIPPSTMNMGECENIVKKIDNEMNNDPNVDYKVQSVMFETEAELLKAFLILIEDSDVITGWNSIMYDFKYLTNRIPKVIGPRFLKQLCLFDKEPVEKRRFNEKFKREEVFYAPVGRVHLDYMELYKKYTYTELSSYSLDHVSLVELDEQKVPYDGTLDDLYKFDFENFCRYNIKDTYLVKRLDDSKKFIDLTNLLAHNNGVLLETTLGTVALTEQAIINEGHYYSDEVLIFPSKPEKEEEETGAAGAFVSPPEVGLRKLVAGNDINSLYPSAIRALNMSPETLVAQVDSTKTEEYILNKVENVKKMTFVKAWGSLFNTFEFDSVMNQTDENLKLYFNRTNEVVETTAKNIYELIFGDDKYCISANGTIFSKEKIGIIPKLLERWYSERKEMQAKAEVWEKKMAEAKKSGNTEEFLEAEKNFKFWDQRQLAKKINLNALYGALLNKHCRFYDKRLGQSTTLTGRSITKHMSSKINEIIDGKYDHLGNSIVYGDTDSSYFSVYEAYKKSRDSEKEKLADLLFKDRDMAIELYDSISAKVNDSFPEFMNERFSTGLKNGAIIKAGRENLASYSLFIKKKRYAMNLFDKDGIRQDIGGSNGKLKVMGIEIKRSDTPKIIQDALKKGLDMLLNGEEESVVMDFFLNFKKEFMEKEPWSLGRPSGANAVSHYTSLYNQYKNGEIKKPMIPAAIMGAIAWNELLEFHGEEHLEEIGNGSKVIVCPLKSNDYGYEKIAYSTDQDTFPEWFKELPFDMDEILEKIYLKKVDNIFGVLDWNLNLLRANDSFHDMFVEDDD